MMRRSAAVLAALVIDRLTAEPPNRLHPVAWFGTIMTAIEQRVWSDQRSHGLVYTGAGVAIGIASGRIVRSTTVALTIALGAQSLRRVSTLVGQALQHNDLDEAKRLLPSLVGRDPSALDHAGVSAAVVESVAENAVDAAIAPIFWALVGGAPGALGYRAVNTMDAMVGHRSSRFENFGWASARLDDAANWIPARVFACLVIAAAPTKGRAIMQAIRNDAPAHPSPNAGVAEAAVAGALGVQLGGSLRYGERVENRPLLGAGPRPDAASISAANRLVDRTLAVGVVVLGLGSYLVRRLR